jgi:hypothetical protein
MRFAFSRSGYRHDPQGGISSVPDASRNLSEEADVVLIWVLVALLLLFAIVGGIAISKFLFFVLIVALLLALFGFFSRTA